MKDKADGPNCVAGPCSQQWPFEANFPAHRAEKDRERRQRTGEMEGLRGESKDEGTWRDWDVLGMRIRVSV